MTNPSIASDLIERPNWWSLFYGLLCIVLIGVALFLLDDINDRLLAALLGLHFGNRSEIAELKAALSRSSGRVSDAAE